METRKLKDTFARQALFLLCLLVPLLAFLMAYGLFHRSSAVLSTHSVKQLFFSSAWHPAQNEFGLAGFIAGTLVVTLLAMVISVPLSLLTAIYLSEYAHRNVRQFARPFIDVLSGISPVIFGVWGMLVIVPLVRDHLMPFLSEKFPFFPFVSENYTGFSALSAGIVLSVMVFPITVSVANEVLQNVPRELREAALSLGATKWETIKYVVIKKSLPGIVASVILGLSRAFGETMAVLMVAGCTLQTLPKSLFDPAYPLPALIANTYGEMMSIPLYDSAVMLAAFILLVVTALFNMAGWGILLRLERNGAK